LKKTPHWTAASTEAFVRRITFDFIAQLEKKMESDPISQADLAQKLGVSEGAVSQVLNNSRNLTLKTIVSYARALGMKVAVVGYDDEDLQNERGPVGSEIFSTCWHNAGKPYDLWSLKHESQTTSTIGSAAVCVPATVKAISYLPAELKGVTASSSCKTFYPFEFSSFRNTVGSWNTATGTWNLPFQLGKDPSLTVSEDLSIKNLVSTGSVEISCLK
jgi:transcriptional regulator with XRE-family HTH domain